MPNLESIVYYSLMVWSRVLSFVTLTFQVLTYVSGQSFFPTSCNPPHLLPLYGGGLTPYLGSILILALQELASDALLCGGP